MARVYWDGAQFGDTLFWSAIYGTVTAATDQKRTGNYSYKLTGGSYATKGVAAAAEYYDRFAKRIETIETGSFMIWAALYDLTYMLYLKYNPSTGSLEAWRDYSTGANAGTLLASSFITLLKDNWYLIEAHFKLHGSAGVLQVKVDGVLTIDFSGDTLDHPSYTTINNLRHMSGVGSIDVTTWVDDLALNDTSGSVDNGWCGDEYTRLLPAIGDGDEGDYTNSDETQVDNFDYVDDIPPDNDTTYIYDSTPGHKQSFRLGAFTGETDKTITRVAVAARARSTAAVGDQIKLGVITGGSQYSGDAVDLLNTYTNVQAGDLKTNPKTGEKWTDAELNDVQILIETV